MSMRNPIDITRRSFLQTVLGTAAAVAVGGAVAVGRVSARIGPLPGMPVFDRGRFAGVLAFNPKAGRLEFTKATE